MKVAQAELEKAFAGTETEKALRLSLENKLSEMKKMHEGDLEMALVLEEKDRSGSLPLWCSDIHLSGSMIQKKTERVVAFLPFSPSFSTCGP